MRLFAIRCWRLLFAVPASAGRRQPSSKVSVPLAYIESEPEAACGGGVFERPTGGCSSTNLQLRCATSTDAACVKAKRIRAVGLLTDSVRALAVRHGAQLMQSYLRLSITTAFKANVRSTRMARTARGTSSRACVTTPTSAPSWSSARSVAARRGGQHGDGDDGALRLGPEDQARTLSSDLDREQDKLIKADPTEATLDKLDRFHCEPEIRRAEPVHRNDGRRCRKRSIKASTPSAFSAIGSSI